MLDYDFEEIGTEDDDLDLNEQKLLLLKLNDELLIESIDEQINKPMTLYCEKTNYLDIFDDRYKYITERFKDVPDLLAQVAEVREDFYGTIFEKICKKYGLELDDMTNDNNIFIMTKVLYEFLILYYIDNVKAYVKQYIIRNKRSLVERFGGEKKLDLAAMKKSVKNSTNAIIITSMYKIIEAICDDRDTSIKDVLRLIISEDESEFNNYFMEKYFIQEEVLTSDKFNQVFFSILNPSGDSYMRIVNEIQLDYIQSLRYRRVELWKILKIFNNKRKRLKEN